MNDVRSLRAHAMVMVISQSMSVSIINYELTLNV